MCITKKVMLVGLSLLPRHGGLPKTMRKFGEALKARVVSFTSQTFPIEEREAFPEVEHISVGRSKLADAYAWAGSRSRAKVEAEVATMDLLSCHVMLRYHSHWVRRMARKHDIPYWFVPHGQLDPWVYTYRSTVKRIWLKFFGKRLMREAAHVIFSTEQERKKAKWFYDGPNTRVIHWPVDLIDTSETGQAKVWLREKFGIPDSDKVLLYLGRIHSMKNPLKTIEAVAQSGESGVHLLIVGPDGDVSAEDCQRKAEACGVAGRVHVPGPVYGEAKAKVLLGADAFISLSHRENFGHTAAESIAAATPVILSPGNDLGPELKPYDCGLFLKDDAMETAVNAIRRFVGLPKSELEAMGARGREFVAEKLSFELFESKLKALAEEAVERHGA